MNLHNSMILNPGSKFIVNEKTVDSTFGPGTTGFISYVKGVDQDFSNVAYFEVIIIKRGKNGKDRLDVGEISVPIFDIDCESLNKVMPDEKRKYYVHIEPVKQEPSVMYFNDLDFLAWALSYSKYVHKLNTKVRNVSVWPQSTDDMLNTIINMNEYYNDDPPFMLTNYASTQSRIDFLESVRKIEATLSKLAISYISKTSDLELNAIKYIYTNTGEKFKSDIMVNTYNYFEERKRTIQRIDMINRNPEILKIKKQIKDALSWS